MKPLMVAFLIAFYVVVLGVLLTGCTGPVTTYASFPVRTGVVQARCIVVTQGGAILSATGCARLDI
jgi:hypothetical protein